MTKRFLSLFILLLCAVSLSLGAKGQSDAAKTAVDEGEGGTELCVRDSLGRELVFHKPVERIITLMPHANEALKVLGCWDRVIGRDQWSNDPAVYPHILDLPVVTGGVYGAVDYETVFSLNPDLFLIAANPGIDAQAVIDKLSPEIPVMVMELGNRETLAQSMSTLARVLGAEERAAAYNEYIASIDELVSSRVASLGADEKPRVFFKIEGWTFEQFCTLTNRSELIKSTLLPTGAVNVAADLPGEWIEDVDREWLTEEDVDVVIASVSKNIIPGMWGYDEFSASKAAAERERLMSLDCLKASPAVREGKVYLMCTEVAGSIQAPLAMLYTAKWLHPDLFGDVDPRAYHVRFIKEFLGLESGEGLFFYDQG